MKLPIDPDQAQLLIRQANAARGGRTHQAGISMAKPAEAVARSIAGMDEAQNFIVMLSPLSNAHILLDADRRPGRRRNHSPRNAGSSGLRDNSYG